MIKKNFGKVKVNSMNGALENIPNDCGYECRFQYDVDMDSNGIAGACIEWCQIHCKSKWGWWLCNVITREGGIINVAMKMGISYSIPKGLNTNVREVENDVAPKTQKKLIKKASNVVKEEYLMSLIQ